MFAPSISQSEIMSLSLSLKLTTRLVGGRRSLHLAPGSTHRASSTAPPSALRPAHTASKASAIVSLCRPETRGARMPQGFGESASSQRSASHGTCCRPCHGHPGLWHRPACPHASTWLALGADQPRPSPKLAYLSLALAGWPPSTRTRHHGPEAGAIDVQ
ncbi:hypothetical protein BDV95DRAFT_162624 [Massariosphaeria phaeospora]|uniref:Uncharacterized protein n=1 Tax=Massariosphaeria phaeospora TaxID=100035 RepID=A0A7C8M9Z4_9PLEO|nr:hypothetical protein BDV95DRAFT_162624 [Massariosphaeria phaeospora]